MIRTGECTPGCGACCRDIWLEVAPVYNEDLDVKRWLALHNVGVVEMGGKVWAHIELACSQLTEDGKCNAFGTSIRPQMCESFPVFPGQLSMCGLEEVCTYKFIPIEEVAHAS